MVAVYIIRFHCIVVRGIIFYIGIVVVCFISDINGIRKRVVTSAAIKLVPARSESMFASHSIRTVSLKQLREYCLALMAA